MNSLLKRIATILMLININNIMASEKYNLNTLTIDLSNIDIKNLNDIAYKEHPKQEVIITYNDMNNKCNIKYADKYKPGFKLTFYDLKNASEYCNECCAGLVLMNSMQTCSNNTISIENFYCSKSLDILKFIGNKQSPIQLIFDYDQDNNIELPNLYFENINHVYFQNSNVFNKIKCNIKNLTSTGPIHYTSNFPVIVCNHPLD